MNKPTFHICALTGTEAFREGIWFCQYSLEALGYSVTVDHSKLNPDAINILFGSYVSDWKTLSSQAKRIIVYNWEQVAPEVPWFTPKYLRQLVNTQVWDYNQRNVQALQNAGVRNIQYVPLGYVPQLRQMPAAPEEDIDVLFYGTVNARRKAVLDALRAKGLNVVTTEARPLVGQERDAHIARAKVVLNMHYYENAGIFEVARVSYLLANGKTVVSELAEHTDIEEDIKAAIVHGSLAQLPDLCEALVKDAERRKAIAARGFDIFSQREGVAIMRQAIDHYLALDHQNFNVGGNLAPAPLPAQPKTIQIGAGTRWRYDMLNLATRADLAPDAVVDFNQPLPFDQKLTAWRFGTVQLKRGAYTKILAEQVFQTFPNLILALTNCLALLEDGGTLELEVPHDLSYDAWADASHVRSFSEKSWEHILQNWWQYDWQTHRFEVINQSSIIRTDYGAKMLAEKGNDWSEVVKVPRAIDAVRVWLRKRALTSEELAQLPQKRFLD